MITEVVFTCSKQEFHIVKKNDGFTTFLAFVLSDEYIYTHKTDCLTVFFDKL